MKSWRAMLTVCLLQAASPWSLAAAEDGWLQSPASSGNPRSGASPVSAAVALPSDRSASNQDLVQVYELATAHDASLASARALLRSAQPRAAQSESLLRPAVNATGSIVRAEDNNDPSLGGRVDSTTTGASLNVRMPLFNRPAAVDIDKARTGVAIAATAFEITQQDFILRVAQAYFDVLSAQDVLAATRAGRVSFGGQLEAATRGFAAGTAIITDTRDAQARYDLAIAQELSAENDLRVRRLALARLTGRSGVVPRPLMKPAALPDLVPADVGHWVTSAEQHPAVQRLRLDLQVAQLDIERARASRLPTIDAVGALSWNRTRVSGGSSVDGSNGSNGAVVAGRARGASVGVELNLTLFDGHATQNRIAETLLLEEKAREDLEAMQRTVSEATERAYFDFQTLRGQVKALEAAESSSRLSLEGTQLAYRAGVRLNLDVLNAQTLLLQTQRDLAKARYDVLTSHLKLRAAAGRLQAEDLLAINRLLAP